MEDIMPELETQVDLSSNEEKGDSIKDQEAKVEVEGDQKSTSGLIEHFLPNLVTGKEAEKEEQEGDKDDERRGGLITNFISNLVSPSSSKTGVFSAQNGVSMSKSEEEEDVGSRGGIVNNLISNLFHQNDDVKRSQEVSEVDDGRREKKPKREEESGGGGGGIIETIVSHFPTSIPGESFLSYLSI